jgi:hypothetical protein
MEQSRSSWNDARLDDLNTRMQAGFAHVDERFNTLEARFDALNRTMLLVMASILIGFATLVASQI